MCTLYVAKPALPLDKLYTAVPAEFVRTRNAVVKELAESGHARQAAGVKRLRRPTVAVWAVNQVARQDSRAMGSFVQAAQALNEAQRAGRNVPPFLVGHPHPPARNSKSGAIT